MTGITFPWPRTKRSESAFSFPARKFADTTIFIYVVIAVHLGLAALGARLLSRTPTGSGLLRLFNDLHFDGAVFFSQLFISGIFIHAAVLAMNFFRGRRCANCVYGAVALSLANSILLAADAYQSSHMDASNVAGGADSGVINSIGGMIYLLITERQSLLALSLFTIIGVVAGTYYVIRSFLTVKVQSAGIQIQLPGFTEYFVPVFPQVSWQNTRIQLTKGERVTIEISGQVSPGAVPIDSQTMQDHMDRFHDWQLKRRNQEQVDERIPVDWIEPRVWPYTGPESYRQEWYSSQKPYALRNNPVYRQNEFYKEDECLTIQGAPHNRVYGIILPHSETPKNTCNLEPAYSLERDRELLIDLSRPLELYPIELEVLRTGQLWVVINDVDFARWDNAGMFFLKLTIGR